MYYSEGESIPFEAAYFFLGTLSYTKSCPQVVPVNSCLDPTTSILKVWCFKGGGGGVRNADSLSYTPRPLIE